MSADSVTVALVVLVTAGLASSGCTSTEPDNSAPPPGEQAIVDRVNDGDTLTLTTGAKVRLVQIDAPELERDCYGRAARRALVRLAPKSTRVTLVRDPSLDATDAYGRLLRYVFVGDHNVNVELVMVGAASPYFFRSERGRYATALDDAVRIALEENSGYWNACPLAELHTRVGSVTGPR